ncbi:MAG: putative PEP-binding protein [Clostridia bacterium]
MKLQSNRSDIEQLVSPFEMIVSCKDEHNALINELLNEDIYSLPKDVYECIEHRYEELHKQNIKQEVINDIIEKEMEEKLKRLVKRVEYNTRTIEKKDLVKIVGAKALSVVDKMIEMANEKLAVSADNLYYVLAIHLSTTIERIRKKKSIKNPRLDKNRSQYRKEFEVAREMLEVIKAHYGFDIPEDEAGFITMYLTMLTKEKETAGAGRVAVVILSHGSVATAMAEVANRLLGVMHAKAVEMSLDESPENALERATAMVKSIDEGKGVLFIVDMGSLLTFGDIISKNTGIRIKSVSRMIASLDEIRRANAILEEAKQELSEKNQAFDESIEVGIMVEIPSAAIAADMLVKEIDFFSIGTNDLTQYTLAADRGNEKVSQLYNSLHPAVLRLIKNVIEVSHREGKFTGMCGELAGNPLAAILLLGMGLDEFSMSPGSILKIRKIIGSIDTDYARKICEKAMQLSTANEIETYLKGILEELKLDYLL